MHEIGTGLERLRTPPRGCRAFGCLGALALLILVALIVGPCSSKEDTNRRAIERLALSQDEMLVEFVGDMLDEQGFDRAYALSYIRENPACCTIEPVKYRDWLSFAGSHLLRGWAGSPQYVVQADFGYLWNGETLYFQSFGRLTRAGRFMRERISASPLRGTSGLMCQEIALATNPASAVGEPAPMRCRNGQGLKLPDTSGLLDFRTVTELAAKKKRAVANCNMLVKQKALDWDCNRLLLTPAGL